MCDPDEQSCKKHHGWVPGVAACCDPDEQSFRYCYYCMVKKCNTPGPSEVGLVDIGVRRGGVWDVYHCRLSLEDRLRVKTVKKKKNIRVASSLPDWLSQEIY